MRAILKLFKSLSFPLIVAASFFVIGFWVLGSPFFISNSTRSDAIVTGLQPFGNSYYDVEFKYTANNQEFNGFGRIVRPKQPTAVGGSIPIYYSPLHYGYASLNPPTVGVNSFGLFILLSSSSFFVYKVLSSKKVLRDFRSLVSIPQRREGAVVTPTLLKPSTDHTNESFKKSLLFQPTISNSVAYYYDRNLSSDFLWSHWEGRLSFKNPSDVPIRVVFAKYVYKGSDGRYSTIPIPHTDYFINGPCILEANPLSGWYGDIDAGGWVEPHGKVYNNGVRVPFYLLARNLRLHLIVVNTKGQENSFYFSFSPDNFDDSISLGNRSDHNRFLGDFYVGSSLTSQEFFSEDSTFKVDNLAGKEVVPHLDFNKPEIFVLSSSLTPFDLQLPPQLPIYGIGSSQNASPRIGPFYLKLISNSEVSLKPIWADIYSKYPHGWMSSSDSGSPLSLGELLGESKSPHSLDLTTLGPKSENTFVFNCEMSADHFPFPIVFCCLACDPLGEVYYVQSEILNAGIS